MSEGIITHISLHEKVGNPHAHILLTLRELQASKDLVRRSAQGMVGSETSRDLESLVVRCRE